MSNVLTALMGGNKDLNDDLESRQSPASVEDHSPVVGTEMLLVKNDKQQDTISRKETEQSRSTVSHYKLFCYADSFDYQFMFFGTIMAIANGMCMPLMTVLFGDLIDSMGASKSIKAAVDEVSQVSLKFIFLALGSSVASFFQVVCWMVTGERQTARIRSLYLKSILRQDIGYFDMETNTGEVVGRMSGDTILIRDAMGEKVGEFIQLVATFIGGFVIAFVKGWLLTLLLLCSIPPIAISGAIMYMLIDKMASRGQNAYSAAATIVEQTIGSIRTVAAFTGEKHAIAKYNQSLTKAYKSGVLEGLAAGLGYGTLLFILFCSYGFAMWFGGKMILEKGYTGGAVINVMFAVLTGSLSLGQTSKNLAVFASGQAAASKMFEAINRKPDIDAYNTSGMILNDLVGNIELRTVHFSYPARPEEQILSGFSLSISAGTTMALVGQSGSGKSTVISLIERFYDPQSGEVLIDGVNLKGFRLNWIRGKIGLVSQEPALFASSIGDNIAYGKVGATKKEISAAIKLANAANFINMLPQGLDTVVGEHGIQLSGGQKQRIAIARAILKDPRILLLDEATSSLDVESERIVQVALDRIMVNRTTVMVAHRLNTIRKADVIALIHEGKIVKKGSHLELLKDHDGAYSKLIKLQGADKESEQYAVNDQENNYHSFSASFTASPKISISQKEHTKPSYDPDSEKPLQPLEVPLLRLASLNKPEIPILLLGAIAAIANGVIFPVFGALLSSVIKTFYEPPDRLKKDSSFWALMFVALGMVGLVATPLRAYFFAVAGWKLINRIRLMCFEKVVCMEMSWFDDVEHSSGTIGARLSVDAASLRGLVGDTFALLVQNAATLVAALLIAFETNWRLALIILVLLPLMGISGYVQMMSARGFKENAKKMYEEASQVANDAVGNIRTVASFCAEEKMTQLYDKKCEQPLKEGRRQGLISGLGFGLSYFFLYFVYALCFYSGGQLVYHGKASFFDIFRVFFALSMAAVGVAQSSSLAPDASKAKSSAASVFAIIDQRSKIDPSNKNGTTLRNVKGDIEFHHVSFKYPSRPDIQIFRDLCLTIPSGKTVALVGESGSGKSTIISLLQRFYDHDSGYIRLDGVKIKTLQLKWLRKQMGLVSQEPVLFNDTIRANIAYGKDGNATEAEITHAAELANAYSFISSLQQGYDTIVGERGVQLSGGQKQRVAIARAILRAPKILLLDEATSALDAESERVVQDALDKVSVNRTTLVVAHRLSTIKGADVIAVVKNGVIAEQGNHETLIDLKDGLYAKLVAPRSRNARNYMGGAKRYFMGGCPYMPT